MIDAVPADQLDDAVDALVQRMSGVPTNQLVMQKMMINQAYDNMGLQSTQNMAVLFDGITRHSPEDAGSSTSPRNTAFPRPSNGGTPAGSCPTAAARFRPSTR